MRWRDIGSSLLRRGRQALPALISLGLITWLVWNISPRRLLEAFTATNWPWLILAGAVQVIVLFLWDTVCVWWLFSQPDRRLSFPTILRLRCDTVIWGAVNLEIGQGAFAWKLARTANIPLAVTLGYCLLLALVDTGSLMSLALAGSFLHPSPLTRPWRWLCLGVLAGLGLLVVLVKLLPDRWHRWLAAQPWANWLAWLDWRAARRLWLLRLILFLLVLVYAGVSLAICHVRADPLTVVGIIPFVLIAESLPGTAGLGEREAALVYLYPGGPEHRAVLLSFGLIWSTVVILGRILISMVSWYLPRGSSQAADRQCAASASPSPCASWRA
jgi:hypothetical protein